MTRMLRSGLLATALAAPLSLSADEAGQDIEGAQVMEDINAAMDSLADYTEDRREDAAEQVGETLETVDAAIEEEWSRFRQDMSGLSAEAAHDRRAFIEQLQQARDQLAEDYDGMRESSGSAWQDAKDGVGDAYRALREAWRSEE